MDMVKDKDIKEIMAYTRPEYIVPYDTTITQYIDKHYIKEVDRVKQELSEFEFLAKLGIKQQSILDDEANQKPPLSAVFVNKLYRLKNAKAINETLRKHKFSDRNSIITALQCRYEED